MYQSHAGHAYAPGNHDGRYENAGTKPFEKDVGQGFCQGVGYEEDGESRIVLAAGNFQACLQAVYPRVSNIRSVEEADQIEKTEPWYQPEIQLPEERPILHVMNYVNKGHWI